MRPNDPLYPRQWALDVIRAPEAWEIHTGSPEVVVAVIEPGIDVNHPDLQGQLLSGRDVWDGDDTLNDTSRPRKHKDATDHGTHVCGIIAARADNGIGISGVAPGCRILPIRAFTYDDINLAGAIRLAVARGAKVINLSESGYMYNIKHGLPTRISAWNPPPTDDLLQACEYASRNNVLIVTSTGGNQAHNVAKYPALGPGVMVVASADRNGLMADFSDYGDLTQVAAPAGWRNYDRTADPRRRILPIATAEAIEQAVGPAGQPEYGVVSAISQEHGGYAEWSGGCMSVPHVSALAALIWSKHPSLSIEQVSNVIRNTARQPVGNGEGWNPFVGHGVIDAGAALRVDRVESEVVIESAAVTEIDRGLGRARVTLVNNGVLDASNVAVMLFDGEPDAGGGMQLGFGIVQLVPGFERAAIEVAFWIPEGAESLVTLCDPRGQRSAGRRQSGPLYSTAKIPLGVTV